MTTNDAARTLGTTYIQLYNLIRYGKVTPPAKTSTGDFWWTDVDLASAKEALLRQPKRRRPSTKPFHAGEGR